jgi:hypothetical protein
MRGQHLRRFGHCLVTAQGTKPTKLLILKQYFLRVVGFESPPFRQNIVKYCFKINALRLAETP